MFKDKILLITGGTGSFGNAVLRSLLDTDIAEIRILSRDEKKQEDLRKEFKSDKIKCYLGNVSDYRSVRDSIRGVDYIFHAAALKQVPSCEFHPMEAVKTNIIGTDNVLAAAIDERVRKVICLSTDKAVYPVNAMGISKAMLEKVAIAKSRNLDEEVTQICCTRYGNVIASRGSVVPLFIAQVQADIPITITEPTMTRFMMSLGQAVELVVYAFQNGKNGDIFVQKAPACTIGQLASCVAEMLGKPNHPIKYLGIRHGEKLHETLLNREEKVRAIETDEYYCVPSDSRNLNYDPYLSEGEQSLTTQEEYTSSNTRMLSDEELIFLLRKQPEVERLL